MDDIGRSKDPLEVVGWLGSSGYQTISYERSVEALSLSEKIPSPQRSCAAAAAADSSETVVARE